jgi:hypothetical protein
MLFPRFTTRRLFVITALAAGFFWIVALAVRGQNWAIAIAIAFGAIAFSFLLFGFYFFVAWFVSLMVRDFFRTTTAVSPFAQDAPPPQILSPEEPQ